MRNNSFLIRFQLQSEIFNLHSAIQYLSIKNDRRIPHQLFPVTEKILNNVNLSKYNILPVTRKLDPSKAHGHDKISIQIIELFERNNKLHSQKQGL